MGLDWNPIGKAKPGFEEEFTKLFEKLRSMPESTDPLTKIWRKLKGVDRQVLQKRWFEIQISPFETLQAPRVGTDSAADEWARSLFREKQPASKTEEQFLKDLAGYYVIGLVPPCDGVPVYSNGKAGYVELFSFRAEFIKLECEDILDPEIIAACYETCFAPELAALGRRLWRIALDFAADEQVSEVQTLREIEFKEGTAESKAHILFSAAKWCSFWSDRGHGMEAYF